MTRERIRYFQRMKIRRSIFIGLGGTGNEVIRLLKREALEHGFDTPLFQYCVLDTVAYDEKPGMNPLMHLRNGEEYLNIGNYNPNEVLKNSENWPVIAKWWGNRSTANLVTVDEGAGQMRAVGRMGFFFNFNQIESQLQRMVRAIMDVGNREQATEQGFEVSQAGPVIYIIHSLCGGTGSSLYLDVAYVMRELLRFNENAPTLVSIAVLPGPYQQTIYSQPQRERIQANAYASLMELERLHNMALGLDNRLDGKNLWQVQYSSTFEVASAELPFDYVYLIDDRTSKGEAYTLKRIYERMSRAIFWLSGPSTGSIFWERAKNLMSKTLASGGRADSSGTRRHSIYSSLGISTVMFDWRLERVRHGLENKLIEHLQLMIPTKLNLPPYFNTALALIEEVSGEQSGANPFPVSKKLLPTGTFRDQAAIDDQLDNFTTKYQAVLSTLLVSPQWKQQKERCRATTESEIKTVIIESLRNRGPIATLRELEMLLERLNDLRTQVTEKQQEQQMLRSTLDAEFMGSAHTQEKEGVFWQILYTFRSLPGRIYFFETFRRNSNSRTRTLKVTATNAANQRYYWYDASFKAIIYGDVVTSILNPLISLVNMQKKTLTDVERDLTRWREHNQEADQTSQSTRERNWFERIRPGMSEEEQVEQAVVSGKLKINDSIREVLRSAFRIWPPRSGYSVMDLLEPALSQHVTDELKSANNGEHLAQRLLSRECSEERKIFLDGAECLWNFTREANQEVLPFLESIHLIGYGIDTQQSLTPMEIERALNQVLKDQATWPEPVVTDIIDELAFIKTQHGLMISSLRSISAMQHAYQIMTTVRRAPYLHIDYADAVRTGYKPLTNLESTPDEIINSWNSVADIFDNKNAKVADGIRLIVEEYQRASNITSHEQIDVDNINHPLFKLIDNLQQELARLNPTSVVMQAMMKLAAVEEILLAQGWVKIEPPFGSRFDPQWHEAVATVPRSDIRPDRVVELKRVGYKRQRDKFLVRKAEVIISR